MSHTSDARDETIRRSLRRVRRLARLLDTAFGIPGTRIRFGLDPLVGLLPGVGDSITFVVGLYIPFVAWRLGAGPGVVARMLVNLLVDWLAGLVPVIDIVLDTAIKPNVRNARLLAERLGFPEEGPP